MSSPAPWHIVGAVADMTTAVSFVIAAWTVTVAGARTGRTRTRLFTIGIAGLGLSLAGAYAAHAVLADPPAWVACWSIATAALATWFAAERRIWLRSLVLSTPTERERRRRAMEAHDEVVQALVLATYALDAGERGRARTALEQALRASRGALSDALDAGGDDAALVQRSAYAGRGDHPLSHPGGGQVQVPDRVPMPAGRGRS